MKLTAHKVGFAEREFAALSVGETERT